MCSRRSGPTPGARAWSTFCATRCSRCWTSLRRRSPMRCWNPQVRDFWLKEFENYPKTFRLEAIAPIQNKVGAFVTDPVLRAILLQQNSSFDLRQVMDGEKILLINLAKGRIGEDTAALLGALLVSRI